MRGYADCCNLWFDRRIDRQSVSNVYRWLRRRLMCGTNERALWNTKQTRAFGVIHSLPNDECDAKSDYDAWHTGQTALESSPGGKLYSQPAGYYTAKQRTKMKPEHTHELAAFIADPAQLVPVSN